MASYRLHYFDVRGRGEIVRMLFKLAQAEFGDIRVTQGEWTDVKHDTPTGELPYLEVGEKQLTQSLTIARYLAREFGLAGDTNWERALVEQVVDTCDDLRAENAKIIHERDPVRLALMKSKMKDQILPKYLNRLTKFLNEHGDRYFIGSKITSADIAVHEVLTTFLQNDPSCLDKHDVLRKHRQLVEHHPNLSEYLSSRPRFVV
uniref:Glutathione S-transferase sigma class protein n=1 Tax=Magallana gigas TaxID=29159 RepID=Q5K4L8_MAGGI|nr:probable glutathione S-transferase 8 [Crassostrea gigas]CAE11863.1 glutathione S-transferase sigma class protein [Crassostrea gigas]|eukprot:NP_001295825.1 probable glutathione S-transferase 8 [Crassostrea gigas]